MNTKKEQQTYCTGCDKNCTATDLHCGKGRRILGLEPNNDEGQYHRHGHEYHGHGAHRHSEGHHHGHHDHPHPLEGDDLAALMARCSHLLGRHYGRGLGQKHILELLHQHKSMGQQQLQTILDIQPGSLSEVLSKLESKGFILRQKTEEDKRAVQVSLTPAGESVLSREAENQIPDFFACLSAEEQETLRALLKKLLENHPRRKHREV